MYFFVRILYSFGKANMGQAQTYSSKIRAEDSIDFEYKNGLPLKVFSLHCSVLLEKLE